MRDRNRVDCESSGAGVVAALRTRQINTSATLRAYGILDFDAKGVASAVRVSPHYYNTAAEIDQLVTALADIARGVSAR